VDVPEELDPATFAERVRGRGVGAARDSPPAARRPGIRAQGWNLWRNGEVRARRWSMIWLMAAAAWDPNYLLQVLARVYDDAEAWETHGMTVESNEQSNADGGSD